MIYFFVRGGIPNIDGWYQSAKDGASTHRENKPNLSVFGIETDEEVSSESLVEIVTSKTKIKHKQVCHTTSTKLTNVGLEYEWAPDPDYGDMHFHILFPIDFERDSIELFRSCLTGPILNPYQWKGL